MQRYVHSAMHLIPTARGGRRHRILYTEHHKSRDVWGRGLGSHKGHGSQKQVEREIIYAVVLMEVRAVMDHVQPPQIPIESEALHPKPFQVHAGV